MGASPSVPGELQWGEGDAGDWPGLEPLRCDRCSAKTTKILRCGRCRSACYCSQDCQRKAWPQHKLSCGHRIPGGEGEASQSSSSAGRSPLNSPRTESSSEQSPARMLLQQGIRAFRSNDLRVAQAKFAESAEAAKDNDSDTHVEALRFQGQTLDKLHDPRCKDVLTQALAAARDLDGRTALPQEANVLLRLGAHAASAGEAGIAERYQRKAIFLLEAYKEDKDSLAAAYNNLAISASRHGRAAEAKEAFKRARDLRKETGHLDGFVAASSNLANLLRADEKLEDALTTLKEAHVLIKGSGNRHLEKQVTVNLANIYENEVATSKAKIEDKLEAFGNAADYRRQLFELVAPTVTASPPTASSSATKTSSTSKAFGQLCLQCSCTLTDGPNSKLLRCGRCRAVYFCSQECQQKAWPHHKTECRPASRAASPEAESSSSEVPLVPSAQQASSSTSQATTKTTVQATSTSTSEILAQHCLHCGCSLTTGPNTKLLRCSRCRAVYFCSQECQQKAWPRHKAECKPASRSASPDVEPESSSPTEGSPPAKDAPEAKDTAVTRATSSTSDVKSTQASGTDAAITFDSRSDSALKGVEMRAVPETDSRNGYSPRKEAPEVKSIPKPENVPLASEAPERKDVPGAKANGIDYSKWDALDSESDEESSEKKNVHPVSAGKVDEGTQCAICLETIFLSKSTEEDSQRITVLECHHALHTECWSSWAERSPVCPLCKDQLSFSL